VYERGRYYSNVIFLSLSLSLSLYIYIFMYILKRIDDVTHVPIVNAQYTMTSYTNIVNFRL
jgi:hypothetical protein